MTMFDIDNKSELISLESRYVPELGKYVLDIHYRTEDEKTTKDIFLNGVELPFTNYGVNIERDHWCDVGDFSPMYIRVPDRMKVKEIEYKEEKKTLEFTMQELEEKLGCKIKIVESKEE